MNLRCPIGLHSWNEDCQKCARCGRARSAPHDWLWNCESCARCRKTRDAAHDWESNCEKCRNCGRTRYAAHDWSRDPKKKCEDYEVEKCLRCRRTRWAGHDWSDDCNLCRACGFTPPTQIDPPYLDDGHLTLRFPAITMHDAPADHLQKCKDGALEVLSRLKSFREAPLRVLVPYTEISKPQDYFLDNPQDDRHGWHKGSRRKETKSIETFDLPALAVEQLVRTISPPRGWTWTREDGRSRNQSRSSFGRYWGDNSTAHVHFDVHADGARAVQLVASVALMVNHIEVPDRQHDRTFSLADGLTPAVAREIVDWVLTLPVRPRP